MTFSAGGAVLVMWKSNHRSCQASDSPTAIPVSETKGLSDDADRRNNAAERIIGLDYRIRAKMMRGFKNRSKGLGHCYLSEFLRGMEGCEGRKIPELLARGKFT